MIKEQAKLSKSNDDREHLANEFRHRMLKTNDKLEQLKEKHTAAMDSKKVVLFFVVTAEHV